MLYEFLQPSASAKLDNSGLGNLRDTVALFAQLHKVKIEMYIAWSRWYFIR